MDTTVERRGTYLYGIIFFETNILASQKILSSIISRNKSLIMSNELEVYENNTLVFRVKIWVEERSDGKTKAKWRGYITHIPDNKTRYFSDALGIVPIVLPYLKRLGVQIGWFWQILSWYKSKHKERSNMINKSNRPEKGEQDE